MTLDEYNYFLLSWWCFDPFEYDYWDRFQVSRTTGRVCMLTIPEGLTSIEESSFEDCRFISSVRIPGTVEIIESSAFCRCDTLEEIIFSEGISYVYEKAFWQHRIISTFIYADMKNPSAKSQRDRTMLNHQPQGTLNQTDRETLSGRYRFANANII